MYIFFPIFTFFLCDLLVWVSLLTLFTTGEVQNEGRRWLLRVFMLPSWLLWQCQANRKLSSHSYTWRIIFRTALCSILRAHTKNDKWAQPFTKFILFRCDWKWVSFQKKKEKKKRQEKWPGTKMLFCPRGNTLHLVQRRICIPLSLRASLAHPAHSVTLSPSNSC